MAETKIGKPHWSFWLVAVIGFVWHLMGCANLYVQISPGGIAGLPDYYKAVIIDRPLWATIAFCVAVIAGAFGGLFLLVRNGLSPTMLFLSFVGAAASLTYVYIVAGHDNRVLVPTALAVFMSGLFYMYARYAGRHTWLAA